MLRGMNKSQLLTELAALLGQTAVIGDASQMAAYLNEPRKALQKELGESDEGRDEINDLEDRIRKTKLSTEAREKAMAEVKKLRSMSPMSAEIGRASCRERV